MKRILFLCMLLTGCVETYDYNITHPDITYIGDSLCYKVWDTDKETLDHIRDDKDYLKTAQRELGLVVNCVPGRRATDLELLPSNRVLFLALGTNDVLNTQIEKFRLHYQFLVFNADYDIIYCVLPNKVVRGVDAEQYRQVISDTCSNVIDPLDAGVRFRAKDTVHMTELDHKLWQRYLGNIVRTL